MRKGSREAGRKPRVRVPRALKHPALPPRRETGSGPAERDGDLLLDVHLREALPPICFVDFSPEVQRLYVECFEMAQGSFALVAYLTNVLHTPNGAIIGLPQATRAPAQALGWVAAFAPYRVFRPHDGIKPSVQVLEPIHATKAIKRYEWATVVDLEYAEVAIPTVLRHALETMRLVKLRAVAQGATA